MHSVVNLVVSMVDLWADPMAVYWAVWLVVTMAAPMVGQRVVYWVVRSVVLLVDETVVMMAGRSVES